MAKIDLNTLVALLDKEWQRWGRAHIDQVRGSRSRGFAKDDDEKFAGIVVNEYCTSVFKAPVRWPTLQMVSNDDFAWSAVFISWIIKQVNVKEQDLPFSSAHWRYIVKAIKAKKSSDAAALYWGFPVADPEARLAIGDMVCYARAEQALTPTAVRKFYDRAAAYKSHADIVVATRPGEVDVIGGNVSDSVTKKTLKLSPTGNLIDTNNYWFAVLKLR